MATAYGYVRHSHYGDLKHNVILGFWLTAAGLVGMIASVILLQQWDRAIEFDMSKVAVLATFGWWIHLGYSALTKHRGVKHRQIAARYRVVGWTVLGIVAAIALVRWYLFVSDITPTDQLAYGAALASTALIAAGLGCLVKAYDHIRRQRLVWYKERNRL